MHAVSFDPWDAQKWGPARCFAPLVRGETAAFLDSSGPQGIGFDQDAGAALSARCTGRLRLRNPKDEAHAMVPWFSCHVWQGILSIHAGGIKYTLLTQYVERVDCRDISLFIEHWLRQLARIVHRFVSSSKCIMAYPKPQVLTLLSLVKQVPFRLCRALYASGHFKRRIYNH